MSANTSFSLMSGSLLNSSTMGLGNKKGIRTVSLPFLVCSLKISCFFCRGFLTETVMNPLPQHFLDRRVGNFVAHKGIEDLVQVNA